MKRPFPVLAWMLALLAGGAEALAQDGIFADVTTSMGSFTCRLEYVRAPQAVANFIGLATGSRAWLDVEGGRVRTNAFFDGLTFHRVIAGFMIQGGSPNGQGTDDPGYVFPDAFDPALRHDGPGTLSMANSGPHSNGAQFFITVAATPWLDDKHVVFGEVVSGQAVVDAISEVATDGDDQPLTPVVLQHVGIRRVGTAAEAFDIDAQDLPVVAGAPVGLAGGSGPPDLLVPRALYRAVYRLQSDNLAAWTSTFLGIDIDPPALPAHTLAPSDAPAGFFAAADVRYPASTRAPRDVNHRTLELVFDQDGVTIIIDFNGSGGGSYTFYQPPYAPGTGTVTSYVWEQEPYRGRLIPIYFSSLAPMVFRLDFADATSGTFAGTVYASTPFSVNGNFTLSAPEPP